jgi:hypothetical protein
VKTTTIASIAQRVLSENSYTTTDCSLINTEYLIKKAVEHINLETGHAISFTPSGGTQSLTATDAELVAVQTLSGLLLRAYKDRGPNTNVSVLTVTSLITDPQYSLNMDMLTKQLRRLIGISVSRT